MMLDFDSCMFELDSPRDLTHKFTREFRTLLHGKVPPKEDFENLVAVSVGEKEDARPLGANRAVY